MNFITLVFASFMVIASTSGEISRVKVDVYYEALCPFARKFITNQLYPALQTNLSKYVQLTLIPYGKANTSRQLGAYLFACHHGQRECYGNKIQACALKIINEGRPTPALSYNNNTLAFINCLMATNSLNVASDTDICAKANNINATAINQCAKSNLGSLYLAKLGNQTRSLQNPLGNVPSVVFSEEYKKEESDLAENDFIKALCAKIQGEKPAECTRNGAERLSTSNVVILLIMMFTCYFY